MGVTHTGNTTCMVLGAGSMPEGWQGIFSGLMGCWRDMQLHHNTSNHLNLIYSISSFGTVVHGCDSLIIAQVLKRVPQPEPKL
jgi:hypothetical protein